MSVLVYTENWDGKFKKQSYELVSFASAIAAKSGDNVSALSIGIVDQAELAGLGKYGASKVLSAEGLSEGLDNQTYTNIIAAAVENTGAKVVILSHNNTGKALAPRLSVRLKAGLAAGVTAIPESTNPLVVTKKVFSGKAHAKVKILSNAAILTLAQNCLCPRCHQRLKVEGGELSATDLLTATKDCCSNESGFITGELPVLESIFRLFLANGNQPLDLDELSKQLSERRGEGLYRISVEVLSHLLEGDQYYGIRQVAG